MQAQAYFLDGEAAPAVYAGCQATALINAAEYWRALADDLARLGAAADAAPPGAAPPFLYIAGYVVNLVYPGAPLMIPRPGGGPPARLLDVLSDLARRGVDVRLLVWIPWTLALARRIDLRPESTDNMRSVLALRAEPALARSVCLSTLAHPAGSAHVKLVVLGAGGEAWAVGYTGGIDLSPDRAEPDWLDVQARLEGPAVQQFYDFFAQMWNQNLAYTGAGARTAFWRAARPRVFRGRAGVTLAAAPGTPPVAPRRLPQARRGPLSVQPLLTLPAFKYALSPLLPRLRVAPLDLAPQGRFEVRAALRQAIQAARQYIYIEDQYLWSLEVLGWLNAAVRTNPALRVALATGHSNQLAGRLEAYRDRALAEALFAGLTEAQRGQIGVYQHTANIHAKTTLIDDRWTLIGSANIAQRSLYTDLEHALGLVDLSTEFGRAYRARLWASRLELPASRAADLLDLDCALRLWGEKWGRACLPAGALDGALAGPFQRLDDPIPTAPQLDREWYEMIEDPDSRQPWYFPLRRSYPKYD